MTDCPGPGLSILVSRVALVAAWPAVPAAVLPTPALPVGTSPRRRAQQQLGKSCFRWKLLVGLNLDLHWIESTPCQ